MLGSHFYHSRIRKSVAVFGALFNNIYVLRTDAAGTKVLNQQKVPLSYAPREKFLDRIRENEDLNSDTKVAVKLPRMSFEMLSIDYDPQRQLPKTNQFKKYNETSGFSNIYTPVPYIITFQLNIFAKQQEDALQIVEQIIPYFNPQYSVSIKPIEEYPEIIEDTPVILNGVSFIDDYEGSVGDRRTIIYTLDFTMKINFYGPIDTNQNVIRKAITPVDDETIPDGEIVTVTLDPGEANPNDDYGFNVDIDPIIRE